MSPATRSSLEAYGPTDRRRRPANGSRECLDPARRRDPAGRSHLDAGRMPSSPRCPRCSSTCPIGSPTAPPLPTWAAIPTSPARGYAAVRVDLRGTGDSEGLLRGEYLPQEQDDALEVLAWLARQPWCTGAVGMIGYSWGGFNGLQIAARAPPAAQGRHHGRLHRRPLPGRLPLHGRLPARFRHAQVGGFHAHLRPATARSPLRRPGGGGTYGWSGSKTLPNWPATGYRIS